MRETRRAAAGGRRRAWAALAVVAAIAAVVLVARRQAGDGTSLGPAEQEDEPSGPRVDGQAAHDASPRPVLRGAPRTADAAGFPAPARREPPADAAQTVADLLANLDLADEARAVEILRAVGALGGAEAERALLALLAEDLSPEIRFAIVTSWPADGLERVEALVAEAPPRVQASLIQILGRSREQRFGATIREVLASSTENRVVRSGLRALGHLGDELSVARLLDVVASRPAYAEAAQEAFQWIPDARSLERLLGHWEELDEVGRSAVLLAAGRLEEVTSPLHAHAIRMLDHPDLSVRTAAAGVLGRPGDDAVVNRLADYVLDAETVHDQLAGLQALGRVGTRAAARAGRDLLDRLPEHELLHGLGASFGERPQGD